MQDKSDAVAELRKLAREYSHYALKMPSDPYRERWQIISDALKYRADVLEASNG